MYNNGWHLAVQPKTAGKGTDPMNDFVITTENAADLPEEFIRENEIGLLSLYYTIDGETYGPGHREEMPPQEFYARMRAGALPKTMQVNPQQAYARFKSYLQQGKDVLHIALTSAVSGSCNSARMAAQELMEEFPERTIAVVDTLVGTICEGMVVDHVTRLKKAGQTMEEITGWIKTHMQNFCLYATVDDLKHLYRGGRVSRSAAFLGSAIGIKPILKLNEEGSLVPIGKVRGRKKSLDTLVDHMERLMGRFRQENDTIYLSHGDCLEEAKYIANRIKEKFGIEKVMINFIGPTIGAHAGPGAIALAFLGEEK